MLGSRSDVVAVEAVEVPGMGWQPQAPVRAAQNYSPDCHGPRRCRGVQIVGVGPGTGTPGDMLESAAVRQACAETRRWRLRRRSGAQPESEDLYYDI